MIPAPQVLDFGDALRRVVTALREKHPRPAYGGLWALAGFSLQAGMFVLQFFRNLAAGRPLPSIEELSDLICPADNHINVIVQVKRTLTRPKLAQALKEFALIIRVIQDQKETQLLHTLRFQVACGKREVDAKWPWPAEAALADDIRSMLNEVEAHQADPFIIEQADPLEDLWALLWSQGIRDPQAIIRYAAGRLLESFGRPDLVSAVHRDLISSFENAPRRSEGRSTGSLLLAEDVTPNSDATSSRKIVVGGGFGFSELRQGCFRDRPLIFANLWADFSRWLSDYESHILEREIPVFWIDGRSGEGKSVLLRQLVAHLLLRHPDRLPVFEVDREDVPQAVKERRELLDRPALLVVDDLYAIRDRESWDARLAQAVEADLPWFCILACGPTEQREEFERRLAEPFHVTCFTVPQFKEAERQEFIDWFMQRVGQPQARKALTAENTILVQLIFELSEGTTLAEFARRFRTRLELSGALPAIQQILSLSALYLDTPLDLLAQTDELDGIRRLSQDDQRHFRIDEQSVNFAHAHLAGAILRPILEKSYSRVSWEIAWARELSAVLSISNQCLPADTHESVVNGLILTPRLSAAERASALTALYELHISANRGAPAAHLLPRWFRALIADPNLRLNPSPIHYACKEIASAEMSGQFPPEVAIDLWRLKDRTLLTPEDLDQICWSFLLRSASQYSSGPRLVEHFLKLTSPPDVYRHRALEWLKNNPPHQQSYQLLVPLVAAAPTDEEIRKRSLAWLDSNTEHPQAYWLLAVLVAAAPADESIRGRALAWFDSNTEHPQVYHVLVPLVAAAPSDEEIRKRSLAWLDSNTEHPLAYHVMEALVAAAPSDEEIRRRSLAWLDSNTEHPQAHHVLEALVAAAPSDEEIRKRALAWLDSNTEHRHAYHVLAALVAAAPSDEEIRKGALAWLDNNTEHREAYWLLAPLVAAAPTDQEIRKRALAWLDNNAQHRQSYQLLAALVAGAPSDEEIRKRAMAWLDNNTEHRQAYVLLAPLVAAVPTDQNIRKRASAWLDNNPHHPQAYWLLYVMIARSTDDDAEEWIGKGLHYIQILERKGCANVLAVTLIRSKARRDLIDRALAFVASPMFKSQRNFILRNLYRACAYNPVSTLEYIASCHDQQHRRQITRALAKGILSCATCFPNVAAALESCPPAIVFAVLMQCVRVGVITTEFLAYLAQALKRGFRKPGYGALLESLQDHPIVWNSIERELDSMIKDDFARKRKPLHNE